MNVYIVDDEALVRTSLIFQLEAAGYQAIGFESSREFLRIAPSLVPGCVILDLRMPDPDGLSVQHQLGQLKLRLPVIMMTGHGDVGIAVQAMKAGALDFVEKPFADSVILESVRLAQHRLERQGESPLAAIAAERLARLTRRENEVLVGLVAGLPNKTIAYDLGISPRTVELHRAKVMEKMQARSLPELVRLALSAEGATSMTAP
jgi:two-component system response regulator FixJ